MAFEGSSKRYPCWLCWNRLPWMKMLDHEVPEEEGNAAAATKTQKWIAIEDVKIENQQLQLVADQSTPGASTDLLGLCGPQATAASQQRQVPVRFGPDNDEGKWRRTARVCPDCVLKERLNQWPQKSDNWQRDHPEWATPQGVKRDMRTQNKGYLWNQSGRHIQEAKSELKISCNLESKLTQNARKQEIIRRSHQLAQALLESLNSGDLLHAFRNAGARMIEDSLVGQTYLDAYNKVMYADSDEEAQEELDNAEKEMAMTTDYQACAEYGAQQKKLLKALDFVDAFGDGLRLYNVCRAKTAYDNTRGVVCSCGLAFPAKLWSKKFPERPWTWKFVCRVNWQELINAQQAQPDDKQLKEWVEDMRREYGEEDKWPKIGCGSNFVPYAKGFSMVTEIKCPDGTWTAFSSDRLPPQLDDEIKKVQAEFYLAGTRLTAEQLKEIIPVSFPMTNRLKGFPFVAHYPIEQWDAEQLPRFSAKSWCKLAMMTAEKDMLNLHKCFEVAKKLQDTLTCR